MTTPRCRRCHQPVVIERERYEVFEGMHWLCFHLEFEHGSADPDEPCGDSSCPWNQIEALRAMLGERGLTSEEITDGVCRYFHGD